MDAAAWKRALAHLAALPRADRPAAVADLRGRLGSSHGTEEWNTAFGRSSLYAAWSEIAPMRSLYAANRAILREVLGPRGDWRIVEVGGGNGALWRSFFREGERASLTLIDPAESAHVALSESLPPSVSLRWIAAPVQEVEVPPADALVCSLALHHVPGRDEEHNRRAGLDQPGKGEALARFLGSVRSRGGAAILNESDIYTDVDLPPGDDVLIDRLIDSYLTRAAPAVADAMEHAQLSGEADRRDALVAILRHWCLEQVQRAAHASLPERDVYELDTSGWLALLQGIDARVQSHRYTDPWHLFRQYVFT